MARPSSTAMVSAASAVLAALAVLIPPILYYSLARQFATGQLEAEASLDAQAITGIIESNPSLWTYEHLRLSDALARRPRQGRPESRRVLDRGGAAVAEDLDPLPWPRLARSLPLFDAGVEVARIEISRSLRPLLFRAALLLLALLPPGLLALQVLRTVALRAIRTSERLEEQLRQAQKMEAVGRLAGGVAHEFNNLLSAIRGYAGLILDEMPADAPHRPDVEEILEATDRARSVTRSLLAFSRRQVFQPTAVDVGSVLSRVERLLRPLLREDVELRVEAAGRPLAVLADPVQVEQVVVNLVTNARDATPPGGRITVSAAGASEQEARDAGLDRHGPYVGVSVADTGAGIDPAVQARVFDPFFTTKQVGKGTGLGLAIAYGIARQHGGAITVRSQPGQGATFTFFLPAAAPMAETPPPVRERGPAGTETVLLAEDDAAVRRTLRRILEKAGYTVVEARDGDDAVQQFRGQRDRIAVLLLDVIMPGRNGRQALDAILELAPTMRAVFLSGYPAQPAGGEEVDLGGRPLLHKPIEADALLRTLRQVLDA